MVHCRATNCKSKEKKHTTQKDKPSDFRLTVTFCLVPPFLFFGRFLAIFSSILYFKFLKCNSSSVVTVLHWQYSYSLLLFIQTDVNVTAALLMFTNTFTSQPGSSFNPDMERFQWNEAQITSTSANPLTHKCPSVLNCPVFLYPEYREHPGIPRTCRQMG